MDNLVTKFIKCYKYHKIYMPVIHILQWILVEKIRFSVNMYSNSLYILLFSSWLNRILFYFLLWMLCSEKSLFEGQCSSLSKPTCPSKQTKLPFENVHHPTHNPNGVIKGQSTTRWCKIELVQRDRDKPSLNVLSCIENSVTY